MPIFANPYPKAHEEESPMKSKVERPTKKTEKQERSKEISESESKWKQSTAKRKAKRLTKKTEEQERSKEISASESNLQ